VILAEQYSQQTTKFVLCAEETQENTSGSLRKAVFLSNTFEIRAFISKKQLPCCGKKNSP